MIDSKRRSFVKSISWRVFAVIILFIISLLLSKNIVLAGYTALIYNLVQIIFYFIHERFWLFINWGKTKGLSIQFTGLSASGKTTIAKAVVEKLNKKGIKAELIDGDKYRKNLCKDLGFSKKDRNENIRRLGFIANVLKKNNIVCIISAINPYDDIRKELYKKYNLKLVYIKCDIETAIARDPKGLYKKALLPKDDLNFINNFTGISDPFEEPLNADLIIETDKKSKSKCIKKLYKYILKEINK